MSSLDPQEKAYYDSLFASIDKDDSGVLPGQDALPFLVSSGLPQQTLGEVWAIADTDNNGFLTREGWYKAARLIGWLQNGETVPTEALAAKRAPYAKFSGHAVPPPPQPSVGSRLPSVTAADRTKFTRIFVGCGPQNGLVSGDKARDVFVKSQLGYDKLGQIWNLADTQQRGSLDLTDFIIGMFLIQSCMADSSLVLPSTLPAKFYEQASGGRPAPVSPMTPQRTGSSIRPQHTGPTSPIGPQRTGTPTRGGSMMSNPSSAWDVGPEAKATSDGFFAQLDPQNKGIIEGDVAVPFMLQSQLDEGTLATIWDLADIKHEGKLDRDQFAVAMHLINTKLSGKDIPSVLPTSLIPPSLRGTVGKQEVLAGPSSATKDLFDLFDDPPAPVQATPAAFAPSAPSPAFSPRASPRQESVRSPPPFAANNDLLGEESPSVPDHSAELGTKRNELANTERNLSGLTKTRSELETSASSSAAQLADLEKRLASARTNHETETKLVADLRSRVNEQSSVLQKLNAEFISAESDVSALRSEKNELEQALLRDKEEVRGLQRKMKEVDEEKASLKSILEKLRKESRQQKGMVTIAKKQLSTAETTRDGAQKEVDQETSAANTVPLPSTPKALSPAPTGMSQRSNNPFDRLSRTGSNPSTAAMVGVGAAAAAGAVAVGAGTLHHAEKDEASSNHPTEATAPASEDAGAPQEDKGVPSGATTGMAAPDGRIAPDIAQESGHAEAPEQTEPFEAADRGSLEPDTAQEDPFGHPQTAEGKASDSDPFGMPAASEGETGHNDTGFGDTFAAPMTSQAAPQAASAAPMDDDFDSDFAQLHESQMGTTSESKTDNATTRDVSDPAPADVAAGEFSTGVPSAGDESGRLPAQHEDDVRAEELASSDEDEEGPEDLDAPTRYQPKSPTLSPPVDTPVAVAPVVSRRSAPPPPSKSITDELDPFGASAPSDPATSSAQPKDASAQPKEAGGFDDDEFDFSDLPPATVDNQAQPAAAPAHNFDDEFAGFDDEFGTASQPPSGSDNSALTKSYEMVSPAAPTDEWAVRDAPAANQTSAGQATAGQPTAAQPASAFSFDDAFGGDFEPTAAQKSNAASSAPPLPQRQDSQAQNDDIEDVKKLCAMGFPRGLVIAALDANGYDFQKTLNVLLAQ